ncbi:YggS family pyridoxal phosphate-dependent enzyme [Thermosyntropha sp.]|uniref:YggS family pyridoxal phosphate-dependent enzyme n=1 Tax=Thermosyntropha sp. TaxID=2740820 RepID=UPI0025E6A608|nr:YggS family pyridoxal phosphate-dependent enzyme [Thermosyntropha sp.]MBO8158581.1 YggS family pyridoxal phosphate-dependent enzyme [Thermosyntropha sp.]
MEYLKDNLEKVYGRIKKACERSGRNPADITLVAVSKTVDIETVKKAYSLGVTDFGENRVQELKNKIPLLPEANWHMIGRLQTNKVKDIVGKVVLIHSLDRWNLAEEINKRAKAIGINVATLLQINISGEEQKAGLSPDDVEYFLESAGALSNIRILGFMTMAPLLENPEKARPIFRELANMKNKFSARSYPNVDLKYLSMGMSQDFEIAIEEGANIVRIGSSIFSEE